MSPRIVILLGHPDRKSFGGALAQAYAEHARQAGCIVDEFHIASMQFDAAPSSRPPAEPEADLAAARAAIAEAKHIVLVYPTWMGTMPARMKGFFERAFADNFAFRFRPDSLMPEQLLKGRSADVLATMDTPPLVYRFVLGAPGHKMVRSSILGVSGIKPVKIFSFGPLRSSSEQKRAHWLERTGRRAETVAHKLQAA
jgi:putative NADPH-quinone reductase